MKKLLQLKRYAMAVLIGSLVTTASMAEGEPMMPVPSAEELAVQAAYELKLQQIVAVAADRYTAITNIVATWETAWGQHPGWETEFTVALETSNDERLAEIQDATSYGAVRAILQGRDAPVELGGVTGTEALGDLDQDLVFTPVVPCRFFDTRFDSDTGSIGHSSGSTATIRSYQVYGNATTMGNQGGSVACPAPKGEPVGITANFTAAPLASPGTGKGNIRAYPSGGTLPSVSLVNYEAGTNIANAAVVQTCYLCGFDLDVATQFHSSASIGDVMGYFYPVDNDDFEVKFAGSVTSVSASNLLTATCANDGGTVSIFTPGPGFVTVQAEVLVQHFHSVNTTNDARVFLASSNSSCPIAVGSEGYHHAFIEVANPLPTGTYFNTVTISRKFAVTTAGTKTYYVNGTGSTFADSQFLRVAKSATFHPQP